MFVNSFKEALSQRRPQLGLVSTLASANLAELLASCGFDYIVVDTEHSPNDVSDVIEHLRAIELWKVSPIVRPAWNDMVIIKRLLDAGVQSLLIPQIQNAEQAREAVTYTRYPPEGVRGVSGTSRASGFGFAKDYLNTASNRICLIAQIESAEGIENIEEIANVDGVDAVLIGAADLAASLGYIGNPQHPTVQQAVDNAFHLLKRAGKPIGYATGNLVEAKKRLADGMDLISMGTDALMVRTVANNMLKNLRNHT